MAAKGVEMQTMKCPVCLKNYNEPKVLPCAHLLCRRCLVSLMKKKRDALCPLCSSAIVDPQDYTPKGCEDFIDSMLTDHAMSAMVESVNLLSEKHVCHAHRSVATSLCLQCNVKLCQSCVEGHKILPVSSFHKLEDLSTLTLEVLTASRQEPCSDHPDKVSELFCTLHNVLICHLCAASKHRACPEVTGLNEMYDKYKQSLSDLKSKLNITMSSLDQVMTRIEEHLVQTEKNMQMTFVEIDNICDSLVNSVETCRKRLKKLVQDADDKNKVTALDQKSSLGERRGRLTSHINLIRRVQKMAHGSSLVAMVPKLESLIAKLYLDTALSEEAGQGLKMVTLTIDPNASVRVKSELDKIGNLMVSSATIQDARVTRTEVQDSPSSNLISNCRVSIPNELLQGSDHETCLKNILLKSPDVRISKRERNIIFSVNYDCLVKLVTTIQEQITNHTVVKLEDNSQNQMAHGALTTEINSLEFEAMQHLLSHDFFQHFSKVKEDGEKVAITSDNHESMEKFKEMYNSIRQEKVKLAQDEVSCLEKSADFILEDVEAFIKLLPSESNVVIICFDYNAMTKAKHLISVKVGKVKITQRNKRKFEVGGKESDEMVDPPTSLTAVSHTESNSGHSYVKHKDFATKSGINVSVYKADITQLTVDAIVNAANGDLKHDGGVAYAIARAAGPRLELEGDDYVKTKGQLKVTDIVPTTAGNLSCRKVLHAVGPRWDDYQNKEQCQHDLEQTVFSCLEEAHNLRFSSIALSSISSAIFGVPKKTCAQMYLAAVQRFEQLGVSTTLQHIHFVDINDEMVGIIQDTFTSLWNTPVLPPSIQPSFSDIRSPVLGLSPVLSNSSVAGEEQHLMNKSNFHFPEGIKTFITESGINVFVYKGELTQLSVDAIVIDGRFPKSSDFTFLDQILKEEGLTSKSNVPLSVTNVIVIPARNLSCKKVLWATGPSYYDSLKKAQHDLKQTFLDCLSEAHKQKFTSIALCIGFTGMAFRASLDVLKDINTPLAYARAIQHFDNGLDGATSLQQIHIVGTSDSMVDIIQNMFSTVWTKSHVPPTIPQSASESRSCEVERRSLPSTPPTSGNNLDGVQPKSGMCGIPLPANTKTFITLSGINVSIYKADITKLAVDIIVSAADKGLTRGAGVSSAIEIAAGPALCEEKKKYIEKHKCLEVTNVVMTTAGELLCKKVLHAVGPREYILKKSVFQDLLVQTIFNCLEKTQELQYISIAFSSISSAMSDAPKEVCAQMYLTAVKKFDKEYGGKTSVRYIHFVDIDHVMVGKIQETFQRYWDISDTQDDSHHTVYDMKRNHTDQRSSLAKQPSFTDTNGTVERFPLFWDLNINHAPKLELSYLVEFPKLKLYIKQADVNDVDSGAIVFWQTSMNTLMEEPIKNYVKKKRERYPTEEIQRLKREYTRNSTVETIKLSSDLTLIFSVNPSVMTGAFVEERIRSILNTAGNSDFKISIPFPVCFTAAGARRKSLEQFAVGVYMAVEIYAQKIDKSLTEVNVIDTDEKTIRMMGEIISEKIAQDMSLTDAHNQNTSSHAASAGKMMEVDDKKCAFCSHKINNDLERFSCGHGFCTQCIGDNFQQNPGCLICSNKHHLKGTMGIYYSDIKLEGFKGFGSFVITYNIASGTLMDKGHLHKRYSSTKEMAYLPNTENGRKVLMLLKVAWARGFIFTLSESGTRPIVVWNGIDHKTIRKGGQSNGYPDHDYLNRVQQQLKARGVTEKALSDAQRVFILHPEHFLKSSSPISDFYYP